MSRPVSSTVVDSEPTHKPKPQQYVTRKLRYREKRRTNDEIHSSIYLEPVTCALLDTPSLQRLRGLKQLGTAEYVYVNTNHCRFEHSLGVAHLAERLCRSIQQNQPQLGCTDKDVLCVKLAGLFHDVGHGPFSHVFEEFVNLHMPAHLKEHPELLKHYQDAPAIPTTPWRHESASLMMLDAALEYLGLQIDLENLDQPLKQIGDGVDARSMRVFPRNTATSTAMRDDNDNGDDDDDNDDDDDDTDDDEIILTSRDFVFVKEAIHGGPVPEICRAVGEYGWIGRPSSMHKEWLYDIVSNSHSGLDVDKIDYYARDQRRAFREAGEIDKVMIDDAVVAWGDCPVPNKCPLPDKHLMMCYPTKMVEASMAFFHKRFDLHSRLYQHKTHGAVARMICDILCLADPFFRIAVLDENGEATESVPISRAMVNARSYVMLRDSVIEQIANTSIAELAPARRLIARFWARKLYKCIDSLTMDDDNQSDKDLWSHAESEIVKELLAIRGEHDDTQQLNADDLFVHKVFIHYGLKNKNPVSNMRFLEKRNVSKLRKAIDALPTAAKVRESTYIASIPRSFTSNIIRIYCRDPSKVKLAEHVYQQWLVARNDAMDVTQAETDGDAEDNVERPTPVTQPSDTEEGSLKSNAVDDDCSIQSQDLRQDRPIPAATVTPQKKRQREDDDN